MLITVLVVVRVQLPEKKELLVASGLSVELVLALDKAVLVLKECREILKNSYVARRLLAPPLATGRACEHGLRLPGPRPVNASLATFSVR